MTTHCPPSDFPPAVPEVPVSDLAAAVDYYVRCLGFSSDWAEPLEIMGVSQGSCRLFLTSPDFRIARGNAGPVVIWLNVDSREAVDELHARWLANHVRIVSPPEDKPWHLREFFATDLDGNQFRVFYDFGWELRATSEPGR